MLLLLLALLTAPASAQAGMDRIEKLAAGGQIQENAPVKASSDIVIHASPEKVWRLLTDIDRWPAWHSAISAARINGRWNRERPLSGLTEGPESNLEIALVHPPHSTDVDRDSIGH
jgi:uncharacterized membrane protein